MTARTHSRSLGSTPNKSPDSFGILICSLSPGDRPEKQRLNGRARFVSSVASQTPILHSFSEGGTLGGKGSRSTSYFAPRTSYFPSPFTLCSRSFTLIHALPRFSTLFFGEGGPIQVAPGDPWSIPPFAPARLLPRRVPWSPSAVHFGLTWLLRASVPPWFNSLVLLVPRRSSKNPAKTQAIPPCSSKQENFFALPFPHFSPRIRDFQSFCSQFFCHCS